MCSLSPGGPISAGCSAKRRNRKPPANPFPSPQPAHTRQVPLLSKDPIITAAPSAAARTSPIRTWNSVTAAAATATTATASTTLTITNTSNEPKKLPHGSMRELSYAKSSSYIGMDGEAPFRETATAAALAAISKAFFAVAPDVTACRKKPVKVSPAAVVSTTSVLIAGW